MKQSVLKFFQNTKKLFRKQANEITKQIKTPSVLSEPAELDKKLVLSLAKQRFPAWKQLQYLPEYLSQKEKIIIRVLLAIIIISLGFLVVRFYQRHVVYLPQEGGSYTEALVGQPMYVNPVLSQNDADRDISSLIFSGLFRYDENLELVPDLATTYEISEDKKIYTVHLRENAEWHNENPILADDILYTF